MIKSPSNMTIEYKHNMRGGAGTVTIQHMLSPDEITAKCRLCAKMTIPAGASIGLHQHNEEDEIYIITSGTGMLDDGQSVKQVAAGDVILTGNGESHSINNHTNQNLELIAVIMMY